jgi:hypothetical protein
VELNKEDKDRLRLLIITPGFKLYQELLKEMAEALDTQVHNAKDWNMYVAAEAKRDLMVRGIIPLLDYTLQEED